MNADKLTTKQHYTTKEYFALLADSLHKYEYLDGEIRMMAGGIPAHADIVDNTFVALRTANHSCKVKSGETAISVAAVNQYLFPDISAVCEADAHYEAGPGIARLTNAALIVEVLSESTADYDRSEKFAAYRKLPSFREYVLIDSRRCFIETFYQEQEGLWRIGNYYKLEQSLPIHTLGIEVPLTKIYAGVTFEEK